MTTNRFTPDRIDALIAVERAFLESHTRLALSRTNCATPVALDDGKTMGRTYKDGARSCGFSGRRGKMVDLLDEPLDLDEAAQ